MDGRALCCARAQGNGVQTVCSRLEKERGKDFFVVKFLTIALKQVRVMAWTVNSPLEKATLRHLMGVQVLTDTLDR